MPLDKLALIAIVTLGAAWCFVMVAGAVAAWPVGLPVLLFFAIAGYFLYRVIGDRLANAEDDYYEKHVDR